MLPCLPPHGPIVPREKKDVCLQPEEAGGTATAGKGFISNQMLMNIKYPLVFLMLNYFIPTSPPPPPLSGNSKIFYHFLELILSELWSDALRVEYYSFLSGLGAGI
jgi:hypothetical protein